MSKVKKSMDLFLNPMHDLILVIIGLMTVWSGAAEMLHVLKVGHPGLKDILLMFIYLEIVAMVIVMIKTHHLPVRFILYIMITALARYVVVEVKAMTVFEVLMFSGAILVLCASVLLVKFGSRRYPSPDI